MWSEDHLKSKRKMQSHSIVWVTALFLTLLVILTVAVIGAYFYRYVHRSDCQISLYDGQVKEAARVVEQTTSQKTSNPIIESRAASYSGNQAKQQLEESPFKVKDSKQVWETVTAIELFKTEYKNADGAVTVKSADGEAVIAPGTEGQYTFSLKNTSNIAADYIVSVDAKLNSNITGVPIQMRIGSDTGWLLGDKDHWVEATDLESMVAEETMDAGKATEYTIYWQWPFEWENDMADTNLGDVSLTQGLSYTVTIRTLAVAATEDNHLPGGQTQKPSTKPSIEAGKTGDNTHVLFWCVVFSVSAGILFFILILRKRKNDRKQEQNQ